MTALTDPGGSSLRPGALAVDGRNTLYVAMGRSGEIAAVTGLGSPSPAVQRGFAATPSGRAAGGLAIDGQDRLLMTDGADVYAVSLAPGASRAPRLLLRGAPVSPTVGLSAPTDMVVAPDALYVVDNGGAQVVRVPMAGGRAQPGRRHRADVGPEQRRRPRGRSGGPGAGGRRRHPGRALLAGADPSGGNAAVGTISSLDEPLTAPGLRVPPRPRRRHRAAGLPPRAPPAGSLRSSRWRPSSCCRGRPPRPRSRACAPQRHLVPARGPPDVRGDLPPAPHRARDDDDPHAPRHARAPDRRRAPSPRLRRAPALGRARPKRAHRTRGDLPVHGHIVGARLRETSRGSVRVLR